MNGKQVLVVDDDPKIVQLLRAYLEREGFTVLEAADGPDGLRLAREKRPDLVLLDRMLPGLDGLEVCRQLRAEWPVPIIMLTARDEELDKLLGLEMGADDYITKPFSPREVVARVRAVLRRATVAAALTDRLVAGDLVIDFAGYKVTVHGRDAGLTQTEFKLLEAMARQPGRVFTRLQLLERVQDFAYEGYERTIDTHIKNLRRKLEPDPRNPVYILTVYGVGYKFREDQGAAGAQER